MEREENAYGIARRGRGLVVAEAAAALGVRARELERYETGRDHPNAVVVRRMARLYGVSADYLIGNDNG